MKNLYKILITGILIVIAGLYAQSKVLAADNLVVNFETNPLFSEGNFNPGQIVTKYIEVTNNSGSLQNIIIEAINHPNPILEDDLSRVLDIVIKQSSTDLYGGSLGAKTLTDFYNAGEVFLSSINSGQTNQYDISITFSEDKTDEWQTKNTGFDVLIGFQGTEGQGGGEQQSSGGGGGYISPQGLTILNDQVVITRIEDVSATFEWNTSYFSTSQVIYGAEGQKHTLDLSDTGNTPPKYGYEYTTSEIDINPKVTHHSIIVTGLTPNTTYYFRAVSHGSLAISGEYTFKTTGSNVVNIENMEQGGNIPAQNQEGITPSGGNIIQGQVQGGQEDLEEGTTTQEEQPEDTAIRPTFAAALGNIMSFIGSRAWLIIILILALVGIVYFLIWLLISRKKKNKSKPQPPQQPITTNIVK